MKKLAGNSFFVVFVLFVILLFEGVFTKDELPSEEVYRAVGTTYGVKNVIDGDTVVLYKGAQEETVRLIGIDTPETEHSPAGYECYSEEATIEAMRLLPKDTEVTLLSDETQAERDSYDRLLGYITLPDGTDFGARMIEGGFAREYTHKGSAYEYQDTYRSVEDEAETAKLGLWSCE